MSAVRFLWVFLGGGLGSIARFAVGSVLIERLGAGFPFGTLAVNLIGSALLAALVHVALAGDAISPTLRLGLATGFLGGFTTYSAFSQETFAFLQSGAWGVAVAYAAVTLFGCLAACLAGQSAARWILGG
jgi:CrcB protein